MSKKNIKQIESYMIIKFYLNRNQKDKMKFS